MKLKEFYKVLRKKNISTAIFLSTGLNSTDSNINYFAGFNCEFCFLIIKQGREKCEATLFVPRHEMLEARNKKNRGIKVIGLRRKKYLFDIVKKELGNKKQIGINKKNLTLHYYDKLKKTKKATYIDISDDAAKIRAIKTKEEINNISRACRYGDRILELVVKKFKKFRTEADISCFILNEIRTLGLAPSFEPIVASGKNAAEVHHKPNSRPLKKGFLIIDMGVKYRGYCSDITRTFYVGKPNKTEKALYELVLGAQMTGLTAVKPGADIESVNVAAKSALGKYARHFTHGIGHSIGVDIHDALGIKAGDSWILRPNNVLTVEPGVYLPNILGIRIEDTIAVTKNGVKRLTLFKKRLILL